MQTEVIKKLSEVEHILKRPGMYIGSVHHVKEQLYLLENGRFELKDVEYVPAILKCFDEVVSNSIDEYHKTSGKYGNKISIDVSGDAVTVVDNGRGITSDVDESTGLPQSVLAFTHPRAGSNFDDDAVSIGQNGIGAWGVACFSKSFDVETNNGNVKTILNTSKNLADIKWKLGKTRQHGTRVSYSLDLDRLDLSNGMDDVHCMLIRQRVHELAMCFPEISFSIDGKKMRAPSFKSFAEMISDNTVCCNGRKCSIGVFPSHGFSHVSFVNGIATIKGGTHVDYVAKRIVTELRALLSKKYPEILPSDIKSRIGIVVDTRNFTAPRFDNQKKDCLASPFTMENVGDGVDFADLAARVKRNKEISGNITEAFRIKEELARRKEVEKKEQKLSKISVPKLIETYHRNRDECRLYLAEGQSATMQFIECRDKRYAAYPLRGKFINCVEAKRDKLIKNAEVKDLLAITGLKLTSKSIAELRYGKIVIFTDADYDGDSICCLLVAFFHKFWPDLVREGRLCRAITPLVTATDLETKEESYFFDMASWRDAQRTGSWRLDSYNKGLGSLSPREYTFSLDNLVTITEDPRANQSLKMAFGSNSAARKDWLMGNEKEQNTI